MFSFFSGIGKLIVTSVAGTAIIAPITVTLSNTPKIVLNGFPQKHLARYQKDCQVLVKDVNVEKYLIVCNEGPPNYLRINFYAEGKDPIWVRKVSGAEIQKWATVKLTIALNDESNNQISEKIEEIYISSANWIKSLDILEKELEQCGFLYKENVKKQWIMRCPKDCSRGRVIYLTPSVFK